MAMTRKFLLGLSKAGYHRMSYCEWGDPAAARVVVCVHGLTRNARDFDVLAQALEPSMRVVCPDVVGRGRSAWLADKADYAFPQYLADMTALIARVTAEAPPEGMIDWVGTSMGGLIGILIAAHSGNPIRRLVVNDVGPFIPKEALQRISTHVGVSPRFVSVEEAERYLRAVSASFGPLTDEQWRHLAQHNVRQDADGSWTTIYDPGIAQAFAAHAPVDVSLWPFWDRLGCPVLVLRGERSDVLQHETAEEMLRRCPQARLIEFAEIGHAPALMAADQVAAVRDFLLAP
jgi:pimeloyl-ACP methyl ester carboxylesterase